MKMWKVFSVLVFLIITSLIALQAPSVQDKLFSSILGSLSSQASSLPSEDSLSAVVCGSRSPIPSPGRAETCVMIIAGENIYIVDIGNGSATNLRNWGIPFEKIESVLLTHLHSDHISDLADLHQYSWIMLKRTKKLDVFGPEGVAIVTKGFEKTYEPDYYFRNSHHGDQVAPLDIAGFDPHTIDLKNPVIINDGNFKVTAFEVTHDPVKPALGYRFDYKGRSIVISGDTSYSENLIKNSKNVDVLFHEAQANHMVRIIQKLASESGATLRAKVMEDIISYHTTPVEAAEIANLANAEHLIFYHLTPAPRNRIMKSIFVRGVNQIRDKWNLAEDGMIIVLPVDSKEINIYKIN